MSQRHNELKAFVTFQLLRSSGALNRQAQAILNAQAGLSLIQWRILALIGDEGRTTLTAMSRTSHMDKGLISRRLKSMVEGGLVDAEQSTTDHRVHHLTLTDKGREIFDRMLPIMTARQVHLTEEVTDEDLDAFYRVLEQLERASERTDFS